MAVDETLLEQAASDGHAALRFYRWQEPTLSLGYFQRYAERELHPPSRNAAVVRRSSGGGALMHDRELTYALILPASHPHSRQSAALYDIVHHALIDVLAARGIPARVHGDIAASNQQPSGDEPFLCFARRTPPDLVIPAAGSAAKIVGSAQRRRGGAVLQHGAVLLAASPCAPELPGLAQLANVHLAGAELIQPWAAQLAEGLNLALQPSETSALASLPSLQRHHQKHASADWIRRR